MGHKSTSYLFIKWSINLGTLILYTYTYIKFHCSKFFSSEEESFKRFLQLYMGMVPILINGLEQFKQIFGPQTPRSLI